MLTTGSSDLSRLYLSSGQNARLKADLARLSAELSSGQVADPARRLGAGLPRLADLDRQLGLTEGFTRATVQVTHSLRIMQNALDAVEGARSALADNALLVSGTGGSMRVTTVAETARQGFSTTVSALNARIGNQSLFAGRATDVSPLAPADQMLAALRLAVAGAVTVQDAVDVVDAWFAPGGGFHTDGYLGDSGVPLSRQVDQGVTVTIPLRADDPALTGILAATAMAALADDPALAFSDEARRQLVARAGERLLTAAEPLVQTAARLGQAEARLDAVASTHAARSSALSLMRTELLAADPFDAAAALQEVQTQLETHYALTARLSRLSLANYL